MNCEHARPLVPLYVDGELTSVQSAELRPHLLSCPACRGLAQAEQSLHAWFVPTAEIPVPTGFAAHVARRAVAGDTGSKRPFAPAESSNHEHSEPILQFVLHALAVAAIALVVVSIAMRRLDQPAAEELKAHESQALDASLFALDQINREELRAVGTNGLQGTRDGSSGR
ncbi:MAG TPA: zf-HC2 domain-containing protein [Planctomycetes bacterium]|nr:zf-HC2 domain-containing protein [Planctomycetota bacterium]HIK60620.1 zf-HC2 domain-containing protein [Planctomycetota bacterium]